MIMPPVRSEFAYVQEIRRAAVEHSRASLSDIEECVCPLCDSEASSIIHIERDGLRVVRCKDCKLMYVNPRLKRPESLYFGEE